MNCRLMTDRSKKGARDFFGGNAAVTRESRSEYS